MRDAAEPDAGAGGQKTGCDSADECVIASEALDCLACQGDAGVEMCVEPACVDHACTVTPDSVCPEFVGKIFSACEVDADCEVARGPCNVTCRDGRDACLPSRCEQGACVPVYDSCGMEDCAAGTAPLRIACDGCGPSDGCAHYASGCFPQCRSDQDCGRDTPVCFERVGVCIPHTVCP